MYTRQSFENGKRRFARWPLPVARLSQPLKMEVRHPWPESIAGQLNRKRLNGALMCAQPDRVEPAPHLFAPDTEEEERKKETCLDMIRRGFTVISCD